MKRISLFVLTLFTMLFIVSCDGLYDDTEVVPENYLPTPTVKYSNGIVNISCDAAATDNILWINIFRKNITDSSEEDAFVNIGQVLPYTGLTFTNSAQFTDEHVNSSTEYEYYIRYAYKNGTKVIYDRTSTKKITTDTNGHGELTLTPADEVSLTYDAENFFLSGNAPSSVGFDVYIAVTNGTKTLPIPFTDGMDLRGFLPEDFLDVDISFICFIAQEESNDETNQVTNYYWSLPVKVKDLSDLEGNPLEKIKVPSSAVAGSDVDYKPAS